MPGRCTSFASSSHMHIRGSYFQHNEPLFLPRLMWGVVGKLYFLPAPISLSCGILYLNNIHFVIFAPLQNIYVDDHGNIKLIDNENSLDYDVWRCGFDSMLLPTSQKQVRLPLACFSVLQNRVSCSFAVLVAVSAMPSPSAAHKNA